MTYLDIEKLAGTEAQRAPFEFLTVPAFVSGGGLAAVNRDFPKLEKAGNFPLDELQYGAEFAAFIEELRGPEFRKVVGRKFDIRLEGLEARITIRGFADRSDGEIHTDIRSKVVTDSSTSTNPGIRRADACACSGTGTTSRTSSRRFRPLAARC